MKKILLSVVMLGLCGRLHAQTLKGKVVDESGKALVGASIKMNDQASAISDENGAFSMNCNQGGTVSVSFVGYETQSQAIQNCDAELSFKLISVSRMLNEVEITTTSNQNKHLLNQATSI